MKAEESSEKVDVEKEQKDDSSKSDGKTEEKETKVLVSPLRNLPYFPLIFIFLITIDIIK